MMSKRFTVHEANALVPMLSKLLTEARGEITALYGELRQANGELLDREWALRQARLDGCGCLETLQEAWDEAAVDLECAKSALHGRQRFWVAEVEALGVVLKDVQRGLVDFPATGPDGGEVCLCWQLGEEGIGFWHDLDSGFQGRKPIRLLPERF